MSDWQHRDHAEVGDVIRWPADSSWMWTVDTIIEVTEGPRLLAIYRGETEADIVTRVVPETEVSSNAFELRAANDAARAGDGGE